MTGSHGGPIGADPARSTSGQLRSRPTMPGGAFGTPLARLPAPDALGVAAVCGTHREARIGDARSTPATETASAADDAARRAAAGTGLRDGPDRPGRL